MLLRAQRTLGAAKTSAYYAVTPFIGSFLAFVLVGDKLSLNYVIALLVMIAGTIFVVSDTLVIHRRDTNTETHKHSHIGEPLVHKHTAAVIRKSCCLSEDEINQKVRKSGEE